MPCATPSADSRRLDRTSNSFDEEAGASPLACFFLGIALPKLDCIMGEPARARETASGIPRWPQRYTVVALFFLGTALCYIDRISISVAIIPLARQFGYDSAAHGRVPCAVVWGHLWSQLVG